MPLGLVAQLVEQRIENPCVGGSIPPRATKNSKNETPTHEVGVFVFRVVIPPFHTVTPIPQGDAPADARQAADQQPGRMALSSARHSSHHITSETVVDGAVPEFRHFDL